MNTGASAAAVSMFALFVAITLGLSFYLGRRVRSAQGYFAAHGEVSWFVNGVAFAGDYLSAASFLGICGMIAFYGYDGFLYSIGYLAGWIVALFVVAEPVKRLGRYTLADALNSSFQSRGLKVAVGISTLVVSIFYLIPQMVGAGALVQPLLGLPHWAGVVLVGVTVVLIVVSAGMVSTTYVQFLKGALLVLFSAALALMLLARGLRTAEGGIDGHVFRRIGPVAPAALVDEISRQPGLAGAALVPRDEVWSAAGLERIRAADGTISVWRVRGLRDAEGGELVELRETQTVTRTADGIQSISGQTPAEGGRLRPVGHVEQLPDGRTQTGPLGLMSFLSTLQESVVVLWRKVDVREPDGTVTTVYYPVPTPGNQVLRPGEHPSFQGIRGDKLSDKLNFLSLMLALFCGTASLPHILIRYYTVRDEVSARRSTIVGIGSIGFFYILTLYLGLGAMTSGALDLTDTNMAAPLMARSMSEWLFAAISAIAFTTVLGTVSGLILASAGAVTHDLLPDLFGASLTDHEKIRVAKLASIVVGAIAIGLGMLFKNLNVTYLVGWAFSIAASANLPALVMLLFWQGTTRQGVIASVLVGMTSSLVWVLFSEDAYVHVFGLPKEAAPVPFSQPGIVTIPLSFATLVVVSWATRRGSPAPA